MVIKIPFVLSLLGSVLATSVLLGQETQTVILNHKLQIPGTVLKPGEYVFVVEDRLADRAILRITSAQKNSHELVLAIPNDELNQRERGKLILFSAPNSDKQILQGWMCPNCQTALEVVYPKNDAVKITGETAKSVMAVDPLYDKLPKNLSPDDMKVVTLWLLSPKEVTPAQKGKGVEAAKFTDLKKQQSTQTASVPISSQKDTTTPEETAKVVEKSSPPPSDTASAPDSSVSTTAVTGSAASNFTSPEPAKAPASTSTGSLTENTAPSNAATRTKPETSKNAYSQTQIANTRRMPHTASGTYTFGLAGLILLGLGTGSYFQRQYFPSFWTAKK